MPDRSIRQIRLLISSTRADLQQYRDAAVRIIDELSGQFSDRCHLDPVSMEDEPQSGDREGPAEISGRWVDDSDWLILIVGWNYGTVSTEPDSDGLSITESEYRRARHDPPKKVFSFIAGEPDKPDGYRADGTETKDLKDWRNSNQGDDQIRKMAAF